MSDVESTSAAPAESGPDLSAIASRLYRNTTPTMIDGGEQKPAAQAATPAAQPEAAKPVTEAQAPAAQPAAPGELPPAIAELRDDPLRRMFSPQGSFASVPLEDALKSLPLDAETKAAEASEWREVFADIGASGQDAHELVNAARLFVAEPITPQRDVANANAAAELMRQHFGADADQALADAQAFVKRDPRLAAILDKSRLGNDPKTVLKVAQLARSAKQRG